MRRLFVLVLLTTSCHGPDPTAPLWEGAMFTRAARDRATLRGLDFIYETALDKKSFNDYASDYLWCFFSIARSTPEGALQKRAAEYGRRLALKWKRLTPTIPAGYQTDADEVADLAMSIDASEGLGVRHDTLRAEVDAAVRALDADDFLGFDPKTTPPPEKMLTLEGEEACVAAGVEPEEGSEDDACPPVQRVIPDFDIWYDALITVYFGERFGTPFGATFADLMQWCDQLHPYLSREVLGEDEYYDEVYLATHLVYTHNGYGFALVSPDTLPEEHAFLMAQFEPIYEEGDAETYAEFVDTLKAFGHRPVALPLMAKALDSIMKAQNPDGSWGAVDAEDIYDRYHATWTAIDALRDYTFAQ